MNVQRWMFAWRFLKSALPVVRSERLMKVVHMALVRERKGRNTSSMRVNGREEVRVRDGMNDSV